MQSDDLRQNCYEDLSTSSDHSRLLKDRIKSLLYTDSDCTTMWYEDRTKVVQRSYQKWYNLVQRYRCSANTSRSTRVSYNDCTKDRTKDRTKILNEDHKKTRLFQIGPKRYTYRNREDRTITTIFIGAPIPFGKVIE